MRKHSRWKIVHHGDDRERRLSDVRVGSRGKGVGPGSANRLDAAILVCTEYRPSRRALDAILSIVLFGHFDPRLGKL